MELMTKRLRVRAFRASDDAALFPILSDPEVMRYLEPPYGEEQTRRFIETAGLCAPPLVYAVERRDDGALLGHTIFHPFGAESYELGWVLARDCWGMGLASELTEALLDEARRRGAREVVLECDSAQEATKRIAEKHGFSLSGTEDGLLIWRKRL